MVQALVVIVDRNGQHALGHELADHVVIQHRADFLRGRNAVPRLDQRSLVLLTDDIHAEFHAFITDEDGGTGDQLAHLMLALSAEGAIQGVLRVAAAQLGHFSSSLLKAIVILDSRSSAVQPHRSAAPRQGAMQVTVIMAARQY